MPVYEEKLSAKDRALCHELTLGVLRKQIYLDAIVAKLTGKKTEKFDLPVLLALRIGLYQILFTDKIPAYSAINESVNLVHRAKKRSAAGMVNAILRRAPREKIELEFTDEIEKISIETSHPPLLIEKWVEQFGFEEAEKLAVANNETPHLVFRLTEKSDEKTLEILQKIGLSVTESSIVSGAYKVSGSNEILRLYADEGKIYFQDEGSQMVTSAVNLKQGENFLDVCAAPGSKTTLISSKFKVQSQSNAEYGMRNAELETENQRPKIENQSKNPQSAIRNPHLIVAGDFYEYRVKILRDNCRKQGANSVQIVRYDAENSLPFADVSFDVALVDAPCSGTGTIRHNPEIRYFLQKEDFAALGRKQLKILKNASKIIKRGGRIIYSTCSLEREENEAVSENFLIENAEFQKVLPEVPKRFLTEKGFARTLPGRDRMDGFFIAVFERK